MKILRFGAVWCVTCLAIRPTWEAVANNYPDIEIQYFDADDNPDILKQYNIKDIPSFLILNNEGAVLLKEEKVKGKEELIKILENYLMN